MNKNDLNDIYDRLFQLTKLLSTAYERIEQLENKVKQLEGQEPENNMYN